jgi:hypothetical protein
MTTSLTTSNQSLSDELEAINAIYGPSTLWISSNITTTEPAPDSTNLVLDLPSTPFSFRLSFPPTYPSDPPEITGTETTGDLSKGSGTSAVGILRDVLGRVWKEGEVCLFDLIEEASAALEDGGDEEWHREDTEEPEGQRHGIALSKDAPTENEDLTVNDDNAQVPASTIAPDFDHPSWILSDPITEKKSLFIARCTHATSASDASAYINHLLTTNKRLATATHNITAWRIKSPENSAITNQDYDDDGETAAGGRLLHLMQLMDVWDVVVVVSRWYGGVKLGPDRFRIINSAAREVLVRGGFGKEKEKDKGHGQVHGKGKGKGKKG